eukprot:754437-Hanusia_phi.AAC.4
MPHWANDGRHLKVREGRGGEGWGGGRREEEAIHIDGDVARSCKDWIYWRLPTAVTIEVLQVLLSPCSSSLT